LTRRGATINPTRPNWLKVINCYSMSPDDAAGETLTPNPASWAPAALTAIATTTA
jgi:hypothetical protein